MPETARNLLIIAAATPAATTSLYDLYNTMSRPGTSQIITVLSGEPDNQGLNIWDNENDDTLQLVNNSLKLTFSSERQGPSEQIGAALTRWPGLRFTHYWLAPHSREAQIWESTDEEDWVCTWRTDDYTQGASSEDLQNPGHTLGPEAGQKLEAATGYL